MLTDIEARIMGSLVEKSSTTPEQYPLSLNALTNACNQKTSRDPVMNVDEATVARAIATLQEKGLVGRRSEPGSRVTKFTHHVENLLHGGNAQEVGAICVLLLRGPQTTGEIKTRTDRLCEFSSPVEVEEVLQTLANRSDGPFVVRLPRQSGQKEARYQHLFCANVAPRVVAALAPKKGAVPAVPKPSIASPDRLSLFEKRITALEATVKDLQDRLK